MRASSSDGCYGMRCRAVRRRLEASTSGDSGTFTNERPIEHRVAYRLSLILRRSAVSMASTRITECVVRSTSPVLGRLHACLPTDCKSGAILDAFGFDTTAGLSSDRETEVNPLGAMGAVPPRVTFSTATPRKGAHCLRQPANGPDGRDSVDVPSSSDAGLTRSISTSR